MKNNKGLSKIIEKAIDKMDWNDFDYYGGSRNKLERIIKSAIKQAFKETNKIEIMEAKGEPNKGNKWLNGFADGWNERVRLGEKSQEKWLKN